MDAPDIDLTLNVAQLLKEPVGSTRKLDISAPELRLGAEGDEHDGHVLVARDVHGTAKITRLSKDLLVQGDVTGEVTLECGRCLDEFSIPVEGKLEEKYQPSIDIETGRPVHREAYEE